MLSSSANVQRTTIILTGPNDWDEWLEVVKTKAEAGKVWDFVNPAVLKEELRVLTRPKVPKAPDVNPEKNTVAGLSSDELDELKLLRYNLKHELQLYERQDTALSTVKVHIQETISRVFLPYTFNQESTYDVLVALRQRVAPSDRARKLELSQQYGKLMMAPQPEDIEAWLQAWEQTYTKCKRLRIPIVEDNLPVYDFLNAIADIAPEFSSVWIVNVETMEADSQPLPDIFRLIGLFRDHQRLANAKGNQSPGAFPAHLNGQPLESGFTKEPKLDNKTRPCICGVEHLFSACPYLIESIRPPGWTTDPETQKRVEEKLRFPGIKAAVDRARQRVAKTLEQAAVQGTPKATDGSKASLEKTRAFSATCYFTASSSNYSLRDSFILDSGATVHVCNSRDRFHTFSPASKDDLLYTGNTVIPIEGFGSVDITVQTPDGPKIIELQNTALVPSFHTSVVSLKRIVAKKVYWDMERDRLTQGGKTFCAVQTRHDQWVLEYNPSTDQSTSIVRSEQPLPKVEASLLTSHLRSSHESRTATANKAASRPLEPSSQLGADSDTPQTRHRQPYRKVAPCAQEIFLDL